ncbi:hypothetical protein HK405_014067 [Cladochytrium tenue]|nr:hypothetical protein HK405_014067 [Cladochytrium tenue]
MAAPTATASEGAPTWIAYFARTDPRPLAEARLRALFLDPAAGPPPAVVVLADNSPAMDKIVRHIPDTDPIPRTSTRWDELETHLTLLLRLLALASPTSPMGFDLLIASRPADEPRRITDYAALADAFREARPTSTSEAPPVNALVRAALARHAAANDLGARRVLFLLVTASPPADGGFKALHRLLERQLPAAAHFALANCNEYATDDSPLFAWERHIPRLHAQSHYSEELRTAQAAAAATTQAASADSSAAPQVVEYSRAAYVHDLVIGPFFPADATAVREQAGKKIRTRLVASMGPIYGPEYSIPIGVPGKMFNDYIFFNVWSLLFVCFVIWFYLVNIGGSGDPWRLTATMYMLMFIVNCGVVLSRDARSPEVDLSLVWCPTANKDCQFASYAAVHPCALNQSATWFSRSINWLVTAWSRRMEVNFHPREAAPMQVQKKLLLQRRQAQEEAALDEHLRLFGPAADSVNPLYAAARLRPTRASSFPGSTLQQQPSPNAANARLNQQQQQLQQQAARVVSRVDSAPPQGQMQNQRA